MSKKSAAEAAPTTGVVAEIQPLLFDETQAAKYIGRSRSWLRNQRSIDNTREKEEGLPRIGPPFVVMQGRSVFNYRTDLEAWAEKNGTRVGDWAGARS